MKIIKLTILSLLFFAIATGLKAQEKYDYAVVKFMNPNANTAGTAGLYISISGKDFEKIDVKKDEVRNPYSDETPLLNYVQKMTDAGWRVINTINEGIYISFILEKKKN